MHAEADALHREDLHRASEERQALAVRQTAMLLELVQQNTALTEVARALTKRVEKLTVEVHKKIVQD